MERAGKKQSLFLWLLLLGMCLAVMTIWPQAHIFVYAGEEQEAPVTWLDGTWEGSGTGYAGRITVSVTIESGAIKSVEVTRHNEDEPYWSWLMEDGLLQAIVDAGGTDVDAVAGATKSSDGVKEAVDDALNKAEKPASPAFARGKGTAKYPYVIETAEQMAAFSEEVDGGQAFTGQYIVLGSDIDLSGIESWDPIGEESTISTAAGSNNVDEVNAFDGDFNGQGYTVSGLRITGEYTAEANVGLFSTLKKNARIHNLHLAEVSIDADGLAVLRAGALCGDTMNSTAEEGALGVIIDGCSATGTIRTDVDAAAMAFAGGITGRANINSVIANCWTDVSVTAFSRGGNQSAYAGGILGTTGNMALLVNNAAFGTSYGCSPKSTNFGGMAGGMGAMVAGKAWNTYAMGDVTIGNAGSAHSWAGAIAGEFTTSGMTKSGSAYVYPEKGAIRDYSYYADDIRLTVETWADGSAAESQAAQLRAAGTGSVTYDTVFETKAQAVPRQTMASQEFADTMNGNLKSVRKLLDAYGYGEVRLGTWVLDEGRVLPAGDDWYATEVDEEIFAGGSGAEEDPWQIETEDQLRAFAGSLTEGIDYDGKHVKITKDIDISSSEWSPVGGQDYAFNGTFDGGGFTVRGMRAGTAEEPYMMGIDNPYMGFFGILGKDAVVKDLHLTDVSICAVSAKYLYLGAVAAINDAGDSRAATVIDGCSAEGEMTAVADESNTFVGGIYGYQNHGAVINTWTDMKLSCTVKKGNAIAEVGGISALNNRGLVAACYALGDIYGSASRKDGDEGMAAAGNLVGVNAGDLAGCYSRGDNTTAEYSVYAGELAGWITGIGKVYSCWYDKEAVMTIDGRRVDPPADYGTKVPPGVNEEGDAYVGGVVDDLNAYTAEDFDQIAGKMNAKYTAFPVDISQYGLPGSALRQWQFRDGKVVLAEAAQVVYVQPEAEIITKEDPVLADGIWYGRSKDRSTTVAITVREGSDGEHTVSEVRTISGESTGEAYDEALDKAMEKSMFGDPSGYGEADMSSFRGMGSEKDPYLVETAAQLRLLAASVGEDEGFEGKYFRQTKDLDVSGSDWLPIGYVIRAEQNQTWKQYAAYPFLGNYDGGGFEIRGLRIGSEESPSDAPAVNGTAALFGFVSGAHNSNDVIAPGERIVRLENINVRNADIHVVSEDQNYTAGLVGVVQNGFIIDGCSVTGCITSRSENSFARAGAISANVLRGTVLNSWAKTSVAAESDSGNTYAGGLYAMDNRATTINCYSLSDVTGNAGSNNKVHVGGLTGQAGGVHYNCYASGDITSLKTTSDAGLLNGRIAGIAVERAVYYNADAQVTVAGTRQEPPSANGVVMPTDEESVQVIGRSASAMASGTLKKELEQGRRSMAGEMALISQKLEGLDLTHSLLFTGDTTSLRMWQLKDSVTALMTPSEEAQFVRDQALAKAKQKVRDQKPAGVKAKAKKGRKAVITWKKLGSGYTYEIYRSAKASKGFKKVKQTKGKKVTLKKLKAGKKWYFKVRAYKKIGGQKVYTKFSKTVRCKIRK